MNMPDESVIIIDSPEVKGLMARKKSLGVKRHLTRLDTRRKNYPREKGRRVPLKLAYESLTRGIPRSRAQKKCRRSRKPENDDESIIVLSDDDDIQAVPGSPGAEDMIPLVVSTARTPQKAGKSNDESATPKRTPKHLAKKHREVKRKEDRPLRTKKNEKNNDEDLEIVWSSGAVPETSSRSSEDQATATEGTEARGAGENEGNTSFFVDVVGDQSLLVLDSPEFDDNSQEKFMNRIHPSTSDVKDTKNEEGKATFFVDRDGDTSLLMTHSSGIDDNYRSKTLKRKRKKGRKEERPQMLKEISIDSSRLGGNNSEETKEKKKKVELKKKKEERKTKNEETPAKLREIIIDGCNVAMGHTNKQNFRTIPFSEKALETVLDYFRDRGHKVTIFIPQHKRSRGRQMIEKWYREGIVVFTPSRKVANKHITPYDDRYILEYATKCQGIVISSDQYRDLWQERPEWRETIEQRLLAPTFVGDYLMFPDDPLGKFGPRLNAFLKF